MNNGIPSLPDIWNMYEADEEKTARAKKVQFISLDQSMEEPTAKCKGSHGEVYSVSLENCTCVDFAKNKRIRPCKHMIALAMKCRAIADNGLTHEQDNNLTTFELSMKVAIASGYYHVYKKPVISDNLYNALKYELWDWCGWVDEKDVIDLDTTMSEEERELFESSLHDFQVHVKHIVDLIPRD